MSTLTDELFALTANDLMTRDLLLIADDISMQNVGHMLLRHNVSGAPVVDSAGRLVGVISATDVLSLADQGHVTEPRQGPRAVSCSFQIKAIGQDGKELTLCTLPTGMCPSQRYVKDAAGKEQTVCREPHTVFTDWQVVLLESLPANPVRNFMTRDIAEALPTTPIRELSSLMAAADVHRIIIVDEQRVPLGIVTSLDVVAAVAGLKKPADTKQPAH